MDEVCGDHFVASCVTDECGVDVVNRDVGDFRCYSKLGMTRNHLMFKRGSLGHRAGAHAEAGRSALHVDDWMVAVFPRRRRRQANNVLGLYLLHNLLEGERRDVVALIDNYVAILSDKILHLFFAVQALDNRNIDTSSPLHPPAANLPDRLRGQFRNIASRSCH